VVEGALTTTAWRGGDRAGERMDRKKGGEGSVPDLVAEGIRAGSFTGCYRKTRAGFGQLSALLQRKAGLAQEKKKGEKLYKEREGNGWGSSCSHGWKATEKLGRMGKGERNSSRRHLSTTDDNIFVAKTLLPGGENGL